MIEALLTARLKTVTPNVYPNVAPLRYNTPCVVYQRLQTEAVADMDHPIADEAFVTFMLAVSSPSLEEAMTTATGVRHAMATWEDSDADVVAWVDMHVEVDKSTDTQLHRVLLFFKFYTTAA